MWTVGLAPQPTDFRDTAIANPDWSETSQCKTHSTKCEVSCCTFVLTENIHISLECICRAAVVTWKVRDQAVELRCNLCVQRFVAMSKINKFWTWKCAKANMGRTRVLFQDVWKCQDTLYGKNSFQMAPHFDGRKRPNTNSFKI